ncbi:MAG: Spy/CpxP family protein refolding chaperone [Candidatus Stahlbacteria bacterium]|nr:Spy/CpxP family protein refolding chaperone [Candidatus Stahlbacteria bacterium]
MKVKVLAIALIISLGINVGTIVRVVHNGQYSIRFGEKEPFLPPGPFQPPPEHILQHSHLRYKLELTEEQINAMVSIHKETRSKIIPISHELSVKRSQLMDLLKESEPDEVRLDTLFKEVANLQIEIERYVFEDIRQMKEILTPEQKQQFFELFQERLFGKGMHGVPFGHEYKRGERYKMLKRR